MRCFATLYAQLDRTASTLAKREAIAAYLHDAPPADAAWAVYVLGGGKLRQLPLHERRERLATLLRDYRPRSCSRPPCPPPTGWHWPPNANNRGRGKPKA